MKKKYKSKKETNKNKAKTKIIKFNKKPKKNSINKV